VHYVSANGMHAYGASWLGTAFCYQGFNEKKLVEFTPTLWILRWIVEEITEQMEFNYQYDMNIGTRIPGNHVEEYNRSDYIKEKSFYILI